MNIGAHVRGGGKLVPSLELGVEMGATSIQVFTQSPRMWKPSQYAPEVLAAYREAQAANPVIRDTFCHATYLINLATADAELYEKSVVCLTHNLSVARGMGSSGLILHVGSHLGAGFDDVVRQIADAFERALAEADSAPEGVADCPILIENAAGSGGTVGRSFEEIRFLIDACNGDDRLGLCIDTQHLWASGFDFSTVAGTERLIEEIEFSVGMNRLRAFHLNDSKIELGGNRDRHANIGEGTIGAKGLAALVGHPRIRELPLLLEVPGTGDGPRAEDVVVAKQVVVAGIDLYDGGDSWEALLPVIVPAPVAVKKAAVKKTTTPMVADEETPESEITITKAASKKKTAPAKKTAAKKSVKKAAAKKTTAKKSAAKKSVKKAAKAVAKKATKKALGKSSPKATKKSSKKTPATKRPSSKRVTKPAKKTAKKVVKKTAKKSTKR
ncbi:MAG TPA: deoxyribonuclease IV [Acidimicrobiales bacterium]|nr:deoxyribonuclease IV [Acidimicrobiales bacterium]